MNWNHRLVDMTDENGGDPLIAFCEVFYDDNGKPTGYTEPFMSGENMDEINNLIERLKEATKHPILKPEDFLGEPNE